MSRGRSIPTMSQSAIGPDRIRWHRAAAGPGSAACALGLGLVVALGFSDGGYYAATWRWAGLALGAVAGIGLVLDQGVRVRRLEAVSVAAFAALAAWMLCSALWGIHGTEATREAERCAVYVVGLAALLIVVRPSTVHALLTGLLGGVVALAAYGLADRMASTPALDPYQGSLLKEPVGYANSLGLLAALGVVLALGLVDESRGAHRGALVAAAALSAIALALTSSRGALLALTVGLGILAVPRWPRAIAVVAIVTTATLLAVSQVSLGDRPAYWEVAVTDASEHVVLGSGAGSFDDYWLEQRPIPAFVRDAHSLYLETVAELGVVGLALLLCALGAPLVAALQARGVPGVTTAAAAYAVFLVHAGLDWDWEMPVTTLAGLACGAAVLVSRRA